MAAQIHDKHQKNSDHYWPKPALLAGVAAVVIALGIALVGVTSEDPITPSIAKTTLALKVANGGVTAGSANTAASCVVFNVSFLREMPLAFAGTVTSITITTLGNMTVTLSIDHWYKGGSADVVTLTTMTGHALTPTTWVGVEDGVDFIQGKRYLVTATNGTVNGCGSTGESTPILEKAFAEAFPRS